MSIISLIVAMTPEGIIGNNNQLLWHLPNDLRHFKALTLEKPVIMGRKTYASIGKPLPQRKNIIVTQQKDLVIPGCVCAHSVSQALALAEDAPEIMVIGGGEIYTLFAPLAARLYITYVKATLAGDTQFILLDNHVWRETAREDFLADEKHAYDYSFVTLMRTDPLNFTY